MRSIHASFVALIMSIGFAASGHAVQMRSDAIGAVAGGMAAAGWTAGMTAGLPVSGPASASTHIEVAGFWRPVLTGTSEVPGTVAIVGSPLATGLLAIAPNPTSGATRIRFHVAGEAQAAA